MKRILAGAVIAAVLGFSGTAVADAGVFEKKCASCHGKDGKGQTKMGEKLAISDLAKSKLSEAEVEKVIAEGIPDKKMPGYKGKITDDEIKSTAQFVKNTFK